MINVTVTVHVHISIVVVVINVATGPILTYPAAQSTALLQDTPPAACRQTCHPEMFGITYKNMQRQSRDSCVAYTR